MSDLTLAVVGAGPQALTLLSYLAEYRPKMLAQTRVFDPGDWLTQWHQQFATYQIPMLRSACVHHPHPQPYDLLQFARQRDRANEFHGSIGRPSTGLFGDYCSHLIARYDLRDLLVKERVTDLRPLPGGGAEVVTPSSVWRAARVVVATNPVRPSVPSWLGEARAKYRGVPGLLHSKDWTGALGEGAPVVVVGGGLTAAQIVEAHVASGDRVTWLTRSPLRERALDVNPEWLGSALHKFHAVADAGARVSMARKARGGGTVPETEWKRLGELVANGKVRHLQGQVDRLRRGGGTWEVTVRHQGDSKALPAARVVCATGSVTHVRLEPLLRRCRMEHPARRVTGLPVLSADLCWPGTNVHVMGPLAVNQVGPACRTVIGARIASERIVESWGGEVSRQYPGPR